ncbi:4-hydroxyphenylpyruvate dioxygenase [Streptomyces sp. NPDC051976]|uniref:4-hydroxyphenylpyruvate dioxygenase n=1 Tax=Streptomyces sp. NPDC051976 TaxID=3154947 RepID=UPI00343A3006
MNGVVGAACADVVVEYVEMYVADARRSAEEFVDLYGFTVVGRASGADRGAADAESLALRHGRITLVLTQGLDDDHPASSFVLTHGDGVADLALRTADPRAAYDEAVRDGAIPAGTPGRPAVVAFGDVVHSFVAGGTELPDGFTPVEGGPGADRLGVVDHIAVCVEAGELERTVAYYVTALGFRVIFEERIVVGAQAMLSQVVQSASGEVTLTVIEPDTSAEPGQIDDFLKNNCGAGVQHLAFTTQGIPDTVAWLSARGVQFLTTPAAYYAHLEERITPSAYSVEQLRAGNILVDEDHAGQLFQLFAAAKPPRRTFFLEIIERRGARTFGSGNIKALYEAVEREGGHSVEPPRRAAGADPRRGD